MKRLLLYMILFAAFWVLVPNAEAGRRYRHYDDCYRPVYRSYYSDYDYGYYRRPVRYVRYRDYDDYYDRRHYYRRSVPRVSFVIGF